jgi:hypothetical protein
MKQISQGLPLALAALALLLTGCPRNEYIVQLKPQGDAIERTLVFYCADGANSNGIPKYTNFDTNELTAIARRYPAPTPALVLTNGNGRHLLQGLFTNTLPNDVGGAGVYTHLTTSLGESAFYGERFRGNDDLVGMSQHRAEAADQLADLLTGWSRRELWREPGCQKLHHFLDQDFRRDLKNLGDYWWEGELISHYQTNADEEFTVRFGQYLCERGYFKPGEIPGLFRDFNALSGDNSPALLHRIQRLVAGKMGVPENGPVPASLAFLSEEATMEKSFDNYLAGTDLYRAKLKQWAAARKLKPDTKKPEPSDVAGDAVQQLLGFSLFGGTPDHLSVQLAVPSAPDHSNGRWDETLRQVLWESDLGDRTNTTHLPVSCYASWTTPDPGFQTTHFGKVTVTGDDLTKYCLWRNSQDAEHGTEWDAFLTTLQPGAGLTNRLAAFRFPGEPAPAGTNAPPKLPSDYPRTLLQAALTQ